MKEDDILNKGKNIILGSEINEQIKLIKDTENYYISENGNVYKKYDDDTYLKKSLKPNHTGYIYMQELNKMEK